MKLQWQVIAAKAAGNISRGAVGLFFVAGVNLTRLPDSLAIAFREGLRKGFFR